MSAWASSNAVPGMWVCGVLAVTALAGLVAAPWWWRAWRDLGPQEGPVATAVTGAGYEPGRFTGSATQGTVTDGLWERVNRELPTGQGAPVLDYAPRRSLWDWLSDDTKARGFSAAALMADVEEHAEQAGEVT